jgi:tRNA(Ile2) C34 agmatinyltransferase TiaS
MAIKWHIKIWKILSITLEINIKKEEKMKCPRCGAEMKDMGDKIICPKCGFEIIKENNKTPNLKPINDAESSKKQNYYPMNEDVAIL